MANTCDTPYGDCPTCGAKDGEGCMMPTDIQIERDAFNDRAYRAGKFIGGGEVRVTDPHTGGQKGSKQAQLGTIDPLALLELAKVGGMGAEKYDRFNYLKGFDWSLAYDALQRHAQLAWAGQDYDEESGLPHMAHVAWQALCLVSFLIRDLGTDDRPPRP